MLILQDIDRAPHRIKELRMHILQDIGKVPHSIKEMEVLEENTAIRS